MNLLPLPLRLAACFALPLSAPAQATCFSADSTSAFVQAAVVGIEIQDGCSYVLVKNVRTTLPSIDTNPFAAGRYPYLVLDPAHSMYKPFLTLAATALQRGSASTPTCRAVPRWCPRCPSSPKPATCRPQAIAPALHTPTPPTPMRRTLKALAVANCKRGRSPAHPILDTTQPNSMTHRLLTCARVPLAAVLCALGLWTSSPAAAAEGEMGVGIPGFGSYSAATGVETIVWSLQEATLPIPAGCPYIKLTAATMGMDAYKIAVATLLMSKATGRAVRFYAHAARDGGCGVDYVQLY